MKNKIFIHKNGDINKIIMSFLIALIPLIIYGIYKNGLVLYTNDLISILGVFKPILFPLLGFTLGYLSHFIKNKNLKLNFLSLYGLLAGMISPLNCNIILFVIIIFCTLLGFAYLEEKISFNIPCAASIILILILSLFNKLHYANNMELSNAYAFSVIDQIFGRQISGISTSSILWSIVGFIYLCTNYYYKKEIPIFGTITYLVVIALSYMTTKDLGLTITHLIAPMPLFSFIFIAPLPIFSSYTEKGKIIFGILIGIITALLTFLVGNIASPLIAVLLLSIVKNLIDSLIGQKPSK